MPAAGGPPPAPGRPTAAGAAATERVRAICTGLPEVEERQSHGEAAWFIRGKRQFAAMSDHHHDDRVAVVFAAGEGVQGDLIARAPERYFRPPYVGGRGWVGAHLDGGACSTGAAGGAGGAPAGPDWDEIAELLADAWLVVAPPKLHGLLS
jgi:hypothetical protein